LRVVREVAASQADRPCVASPFDSPVLRLCAGETDLESLLPDRWAASHPEHVLQHRLDESRRYGFHFGSADDLQLGERLLQSQNTCVGDVGAGEDQ
jgi:hypothetical protein